MQYIEQTRRTKAEVSLWWKGEGGGEVVRVVCLEWGLPALTVL